MKKNLLILLFMALLLPGELWAAPRLYCSICRRSIVGKYIRNHNKQIFCSSRCLEKSLPRCANCSKVCRQEVFKARSELFCSKECIENKLLPRCNRCSKPFREGRELPTAYGAHYYCLKCIKLPACLVCERPDSDIIKLPNGNYLCGKCNVDLVDSMPKLQRVFTQVRNTLVNKLKFRNDHNIKLYMRSFGRSREDRFAGTREFGLYMYSGKEIYTKPFAFEFWRDRKTTVRYENESCSIVVMDSLPSFKAAEVIAHELAHDYMKHRWYYIRDKKLQEGFAELVAAEYNRLTGNEKWNYRMQNSSDPVYGAGYRILKRALEQGSWAKVYRLLDEANYRDMPSELKEQ